MRKDLFTPSPRDSSKSNLSLGHNSSHIKIWDTNPSIEHETMTSKLATNIPSELQAEHTTFLTKPLPSSATMTTHTKKVTSFKQQQPDENSQVKGRYLKN